MAAPMPKKLLNMYARYLSISLKGSLGTIRYTLWNVPEKFFVDKIINESSKLCKVYEVNFCVLFWRAVFLR